MSKGFIPIRRTLFEHFLYHEHRVFSRFEAWLDLIQLASFMDGQTELIKGKAITRNRGEVVASVRWIASRWNWSIHKTCDFIEVLRSQEMVVVGKENGVTKISLVNFERYNSIGKDDIGNSKGNSKRDSKMQNGIGFGGIEGTAQGTIKGTNGEQSGDSEGTNINKVNKGKKENEGGAGAGAPRSPREIREEKEEDMLKRQKVFYDHLKAHVETYGREMVRAFYNYWTEPNKSRTKMKFEMEDTWDLPRRLTTWEERDHQFNRRSGSADSRTLSARVSTSDVEDLYKKFRGGQQVNHLVKEAHCDLVIRKELTMVVDKHIETAIEMRIRALTGTNVASELRMVEAYQAGTWREDPDCQKDEPNRLRIAKKIALMWLFEYLKGTDKEAVFA